MKKTLKSVLTATALVSSVLALASCGSSASNLAKDAKDYYALFSDRTMYDMTLGSFYDKYSAARAEVDDMNKRYVGMADAEADLLASGVFVPTTTHGGAYTLSRVAPRTIPYVQWGVDYDRVKSAVVTTDFLKKADRATLVAEWEKARAGKTGTAYDSYEALKAKLKEMGYTVGTSYKTTFSAMPETWDALGTSRANDSEFIINGLDGLVEYDYKGDLQPALADALPTVSEDGLTYTFSINKDNKASWVTSSGKHYADVTADDFVAGFQHMLDAKAGLEYLVDGVVAGAHEYLAGTGSFDKVGMKAKDDHTLVITLATKTPYFETMLTYSIFFPMCRKYFLEQGGKFGSEWGEAKASATYGTSKDNILYNGAFICDEATANSKIHFAKNDSYYKPEIRNVDEVDYTYDAGEDPAGTYKAVISGTYTGIGLSNTTLPLAQADGNLDKYGYVSDTDATTFFGGWNLNRRTFALENGGVASPKTVDAARAYAVAIGDANFRKALSHSINRETMNAVSRGTDLAKTNLRNMYTSPSLVSLPEAYTYTDGHTFEKGTSYGELVQYFIDKNYGGEYKVSDGQDGWYSKELTQKYLAKAQEDLDAAVFAKPIEIDIEYYASSTIQTGQAQAVKASIEDAFTVDGHAYVQVNLVSAATSDDYYDAGYYAPTGADADYDLFYGSGWGPDFGDPLTYLDTYLPDGAGYMTKVQGLW